MSLKLKKEWVEMNRKPLVIGFLIGVIGAILIQVSQVHTAEETISYERVIDKYYLGKYQFRVNISIDLQANTNYRLEIKDRRGGEIGTHGYTRDYHVIMPNGQECFNLKQDYLSNFVFTTGYMDGIYQIYDAYMTEYYLHTYVEVSHIILIDTVIRPFGVVRYVGIALVIVSASFAILGLNSSRKKL
jgi:hypothetical protein